MHWRVERRPATGRLFWLGIILALGVFSAGLIRSVTEVLVGMTSPPQPVTVEPSR